jgi:hypothetical protein
VHGDAYINDMMINGSLALAAVLVLQLFAMLSAVDGLYIHLWKLRLHARPASYREHLLHTARAVLFVPVLVLVFALPTAGPLLWAGIALALLDQVVGVTDALAERDSRASMGGLGRGEYAIHVVLVALHAIALTLALAARPSAAWASDAPMLVGELPAAVKLLVAGPVLGGLLVATLHVVLAWPARRSLACCFGARVA